MLTMFRHRRWVFLAALIAVLCFPVMSCTLEEDSPGAATPTHNGDGPSDIDSPPSSGSMAIVPSSYDFTVNGSHVGDSASFFVTGGTPPFTWQNTFHEIGGIWPMDPYGDGSYRRGKYTLKSISWVGDDTILVIDSKGVTATATVTVEYEAPPVETLGITPGSVTLTGGGTLQFFATGGIGPYDWADSAPNLTTNPSNPFTSCGASFSCAKVTYTATADGTDTIILRDSSGQTATATVTVAP